MISNVSVQMSSNDTFHQGPGSQHCQFEIASCNYIPFGNHINSMKYKHAVESTGQISLFVVLKTLIFGGPEFQDQFVDIIQNAMGGACLTNHFSDVELVKLQEGKPSTWDVILLYKVVQKVCGLAPMNSGTWTKKEDGNATLESLLYEMKELRVEMTHNVDHRILSDAELEALLEELRTLSVKILDALVGAAIEGGREFDIDGIEKAKMSVDDVIDDVKQMVMDQ